jgi:hypothetical protein
MKKTHQFERIEVLPEHNALAERRTAFLMPMIETRTVRQLLANAYLQGLWDTVEHMTTPNE